MCRGEVRPWQGEERRKMERRKGERRKDKLSWDFEKLYQALIVEGRPIRDPNAPDRRSGKDRRKGNKGC